MAARPSRVGLLACFHETNTFVDRPTDRAAFERRPGWLLGQELVDTFAGTKTVVGGMLAEAERRRLELVPIFGAYATPAGPVPAATFQGILEEIASGLDRAGHLDGLLVELHGAMVVEGDDDPETRLLRSLREQLGSAAPIVAVTDLHANMTPARTELVDALVGYRTNPHIDTFERGVDAARHLDRLLGASDRLVIRHRRVPVLAAPIAQRTDDEPLRGLLASARELERRYGLIDVTLHGGYAYSDVRHAGMSLTVTAASGAATEVDEVLDQLTERAWTSRHEFLVDLPDAPTAVARARAMFEGEGGPVAMADTGDNINGGGPGDTTWLLEAALDGSPGRVAATLWDPQTVEEAHAVGAGARFTAHLGGKSAQLSGAPLRHEVTVRHLGGGEFTNTGPMAHGARVTMGKTAVVSIGDAADVILQSLPVQPNDPEMFRSVGFSLDDYALVLLKGAAAIRAGWSPLVTGFIDVGTRGVTDCDLQRLPYQNLTDVWPLEPVPAPTKADT